MNYLVLPLNITQSNSRQRIKPTTEHTTITIKVCCIESLRLSAAFCYKKEKKRKKEEMCEITMQMQMRHEKEKMERSSTTRKTRKEEDSVYGTECL